MAISNQNKKISTFEDLCSQNESFTNETEQLVYEFQLIDIFWEFTCFDEDPFYQQEINFDNYYQYIIILLQSPENQKKYHSVYDRFTQGYFDIIYQKSDGNISYKRCYLKSDLFQNNPSANSELVSNNNTNLQKYELIINTTCMEISQSQNYKQQSSNQYQTYSSAYSQISQEFQNFNKENCEIQCVNNFSNIQSQITYDNKNIFSNIVYSNDISQDDKQHDDNFFNLNNDIFKKEQVLEEAQMLHPNEQQINFSNKDFQQKAINALSNSINEKEQKSQFNDIQSENIINAKAEQKQLNFLLNKIQNHIQFMESFFKNKIKDNQYKNKIIQLLKKRHKSICEFDNITDSELIKIFINNLNQFQEFYDEFVLSIRAYCKVYFLLFGKFFERSGQRDRQENRNNKRFQCICGIKYLQLGALQKHIYKHLFPNGEQQQTKVKTCYAWIFQVEISTKIGKCSSSYMEEENKKITQFINSCEFKKYENKLQQFLENQ